TSTRRRGASRRPPAHGSRGSGSASDSGWRRRCSCSSVRSSSRRERFRPGRRSTSVSVEGGVMARRLGSCLVVLLALPVVPTASAAFPGPYGLQGGKGVLSNDGTLRFVASKSAEGTLVKAISTADGTVQASRAFDGQLGIPTLQFGKVGDGVSRDGKTFVLETAGL